MIREAAPRFSHLVTTWGVDHYQFGNQLPLCVVRQRAQVSVAISCIAISFGVRTIDFDSSPGDVFSGLCAEPAVYGDLCTSLIQKELVALTGVEPGFYAFLCFL
jgi:hypothetical protein